jgi:hypothetical protein
MSKSLPFADSIAYLHAQAVSCDAVCIGSKRIYFLPKSFVVRSQPPVTGVATWGRMRSRGEGGSRKVRSRVCPARNLGHFRRGIWCRNSPPPERPVRVVDKDDVKVIRKVLA